MQARSRKPRAKRKSRLKKIRVHFGMFDFTVHVVIGDEREAMDFASGAHRKQYSETHTLGRAYGTIYRHNDYEPVIWLPKFPKTTKEHGTLAHEALHAVNELARWAGLDMTYESEETFCHALDYIVEKVLEAGK